MLILGSTKFLVYIHYTLGNAYSKGLNNKNGNPVLFSQFSLIKIPNKQYYINLTTLAVSFRRLHCLPQLLYMYYKTASRIIINKKVIQGLQ